jgi:hypothetical protein
MSDMSTYLSDVTADYTTTSLTVSPHNIMVEEGDMVQVVRKMDNGQPVVTTLSGSTFKVTLQWTYLESADETTIFDFYHDTGKAKGRERKFYWYHPEDEKYYTVSFMGPLKKIYDARKPGGIEISQIELFVWGDKPGA